jgi:PqqD family protein of HPr-rel-A system
LSQPIWQTFRLLHKDWGEDEIVVFNSASGNTHLINATAWKIVYILQSKPCSAFELAEQIAAESQLDVDEEIVRRIEIVLNTLDELGLIEPLPS